MKIPSRISLYVLGAALLALHVALAVQWVRQDAKPPAWDPSVHLGTALDYREAAAEGRWLDFFLRTRHRPGHPPYPPFYHYTAAPLATVERPHHAVIWLNLAYFAIFAGAGAWIAFQLGGAGPAAVALLALALSPGAFFSFREAFPDLALAAWVTLAYGFLLRSRLWELRGSSLGVGLCAALALYSKWGAFLYLLPAAIAGLWSPVRRRNLGLALGLTLVCMPWYVVNLLQMLPRIWNSVTLGHRQGHPLTWTWANWLFYPRNLAYCYSLPGSLIFAAGCFWALRSRGRDALLMEGRKWVAAWLVFSYFFWTLVPNKDTRYFLPTVAALPALGATALPVPVLAVSSLAALFHARNLPNPDSGNWRDREILQALQRRLKPEGLTTVCVLANHVRLNATSLTWMARHARHHQISVGCQESEIPEWADLVLIKTKDPGVFLADETHAILAQAASKSGLFSRVFREAERWPLPDGSDAVLYEPRPDAPLLRRELRLPKLQVRSASLERVHVKPVGRFDFEVQVDTLTLAKLAAPVRGLRLRLIGARLVENSGRIYVLGIQRIVLESAQVGWEALSQALSSRSKLPMVLQGADGGVLWRGSLGPLSAQFQLEAIQEKDALSIHLSRMRLAGVPLPLPLTLRQPLSPQAPYRPYHLDLGPLIFQEQMLRIGHPRWANRPL